MTADFIRDEGDAIKAAIDRGDHDSQLLDGRYYDPTPWDEARAALDAEREAHQLTRTALNASTSVMAQSLAWILRKTRGSDADMRFAREIDALVQANQRVLGLAVAEADKPHDGNER